MKKLNKKGFTIVELVIVISVIAILSAVLVPTFSGVISSSKDSADLQSARNAYTAYTLANKEAAEIEENLIYKGENGRWIAIVNGKAELAENEADAMKKLGFEGNYETKKLTDTEFYEVVEKAPAEGDEAQG